jgi:hypothetical protein
MSPQAEETNGVNKLLQFGVPMPWAQWIGFASSIESVALGFKLLKLVVFNSYRASKRTTVFAAGDFDLTPRLPPNEVEETWFLKYHFILPLGCHLRLRWTARKAVKAERSERSLALTD